MKINSILEGVGGGGGYAKLFRNTVQQYADTNRSNLIIKHTATQISLRN